MNKGFRPTFEATEHVRFPTLIISLFISGVFVLIVRFVYNIYFHPLSAFKGPKHLIISDVPLAVLQLRGTAHYALKKTHEKYGSIVRIGPRTLSFINASAWNDIYGLRKGGRAALPKDPQFYNETLFDKETITLASDDDALPIRRAMNPAFSHKALLDQEPMLQDHVRSLISQLSVASLGNKNSQTDQKRSIDIRKWFTFSIFDINSDFVFGEDMGCVASGSFHEWVQFVIDYFYAATLLHQIHKFLPFRKLPEVCIPKSIRQRQQRHNEISLKRVRSRINRETDRPDFMHHFLYHAEKEGLPMSTIEAQATVVVLAGSETTSIALTAAVYHILRNPNVYQRLCKEVRSNFATTSDITLQSVLSNLPYLEAVVQETLRIHAPLANGFTRHVVDPQGALISGSRIPKGTIVIINHYCSNTSAQNFRLPFSFVPDRWLDDPAYSSDNRDVVQPFSVGPRNCPGRMFALNNIKLTLAHLIWTFDMELEKGLENWGNNQKIFNGWFQPALPVLITKRV